MSTVRFLGVTMHNLTLADTLALIDQRISEGHFTQHVVVNVAKLVNMKKDEALRASVESCDIVNIDGMGVVWGGRLLGQAIPERVAGIDLFQSAVALAADKGYPIYLLGAKPEVVEKVARMLRHAHPDLQIAGYHHGYFWDDEARVVEQVRASGAKMLFVAISSPQKETFIERWKDDLGVLFVMGVGGSFDVLAGQVKRAPGWMQRAGLEWFYRLIQEPKRMWRRYLVSNALFAYLLARAKLRQLLTPR